MLGWNELQDFLQKLSGERRASRLILPSATPGVYSLPAVLWLGRISSRRDGVHRAYASQHASVLALVQGAILQAPEPGFSACLTSTREWGKRKLLKVGVGNSLASCSPRPHHNGIFESDTVAAISRRKSKRRLGINTTLQVETPTSVGLAVEEVISYTV